MAFNGNQGVERCLGALQFNQHLMDELNIESDKNKELEQEVKK